MWSYKETSTRLRWKMWKEQFLILFFVFNIPNSFCISENALEAGTSLNGYEQNEFFPKDSSPQSPAPESTIPLTAPDNRIEAGESFFEFGLFQEIIFEYHPLDCSITCWDIYNYGRCNVRWLIDKTGCDGEVVSCAWLGDIKACASRESQRKVQWVDSEQFGKMGKNHNSCPAEKGFLTYIPRKWYKRKNWSTCHCHCIKNKWRIYVGQLQSRESDNYVITGVRFKLQDKVLFLQPAEGKLEANGRVSDFSWVPLPNDPSQYRSVNLDSRNFFLDDLQLEHAHAVTGVKFEFIETVNPSKINGFAITISGVPFNYETGKLDLVPENKKIVKAQSSALRKELLYKLVSPLHTETSSLNEPSPKEYNYVTLKQSSLRDDFGQSTVPLFDSTPVTINQQSPLAGIGIFHTGSYDHAGFITLRLHPIK